LSDWTTFNIFVMKRRRELYFYGDYFDTFYEKCEEKVRQKILRIFCFFDSNSRIFVGNGFQKKTQKIPKQQIKMAEKLKKEYYERKG